MLAIRLAPTSSIGINNITDSAVDVLRYDHLDQSRLVAVLDGGRLQQQCGWSSLTGLESDKRPSEKQVTP